MWRFGKIFSVAAVLAITLAAPSVGFAHSMGGAYSRSGPAGNWSTHGGMGPGMIGMGYEMEPGMMGMMHSMMGYGPGQMGTGYRMMPGNINPLTEDQEKKLADIQSRFLKESVKPRTDLIQARIQLQRLMNDPSAKEDAIETQAQKSASARARLFVLRIRAAREISEIYTKQQREQFKRLPAYGPMGMMGTAGTENPCGTDSSGIPMRMR